MESSYSWSLYCIQVERKRIDTVYTVLYEINDLKNNKVIKEDEGGVFLSRVSILEGLDEKVTFE